MASAPAVTAPLSLSQPDVCDLGPAFATRVVPASLQQPHWVDINHPLADELGLDEDWRTSAQALAVFSGNALPETATPVATVYSGHQFGVWAGQLGDGRAMLIGQLAGQQLQLKGSGRTPYSRGADGRAVLRSSIREYLCSAAMHGLGIPTTRALCIVGSTTPVWRETKETAAVLTRTAPSFVRFGHFEHFSYSGQHRELQALADFVIHRFYPDCLGQPRPVLALLAAVVERTARLVAAWQAAGFMHGVMNTDNMSILGLTLDYGPFQFMDAFDPAHVCNHSDHLGRYAYENQPAIAYWNLRALGHALMPLIRDKTLMQDTVRRYEAAFANAMAARMAAKLGFAHASAQSNELVTDLLGLLAGEHTDWPIFWYRLTQHMAGMPGDPVRDLFLDRAAFDRWLARLDALAAAPGAAHDTARMQRHNPAVVLRNYMAEEAIASAQHGDFSGVATLLQALQQPAQAPEAHPQWLQLPPDWAASIQVSCSS